jgi:hypothetical protein
MMTRAQVIDVSFSIHHFFSHHKSTKMIWAISILFTVSFASLTVINIPSLSVYTFDGVLHPQSTIRFNFDETQLYHIVFHYITRDQVFLIYQQLKNNTDQTFRYTDTYTYTSENLSTLLSVNTIPHITGFTVISSLQTRLHFTFFNAFCPTSLIVSNKLSVKLSFPNQFPLFQSITQNDICIFCNYTFPYRIRSNITFTLLSMSNQIAVNGFNDVEMNSPSLLRFQNILCSNNFDILIDSHSSIRNDAITAIIPAITDPIRESTANFSDRFEPSLERIWFHEVEIAMVAGMLIIGGCIIVACVCDRRSRRARSQKSSCEDEHQYIDSNHESPVVIEIDNQLEPCFDDDIQLVETGSVIETDICSVESLSETQPTSPYDGYEYAGLL